MGKYKNASFPPSGPWDRRLEEADCAALGPAQTVHENPWFAVKNRAGYFTVEYYLRQVAVLPVVENDSIVLVRVKRPILNDATLELPAGAIERNELPAAAAARELAEESGIMISDLGRFVPMPPVSVSATRMPTLSYVFRVNVTANEFADRKAHDNEVCAVERIHIENLRKMMLSGEIYVSLTLATIGVYLCTRLP